jgi:hypothetical protein
VKQQDAIMNVGLWGDGDEIAAMKDIEEEFNVRLDYADCSNWHTAGDVYLSLRRVLPVDETANPYVWDRFAKALAKQTGVNPNHIGSESRLLAERTIWRRIHDISAFVWLLVMCAILVVSGLAVLTK